MRKAKEFPEANKVRTLQIILCTWYDLFRYLSLHWHVCSARSREDAHELLKRVEGLRVSLEFGGDVIQVDEVGGERRVVVGKVPLPGCASLNENSY